MRSIKYTYISMEASGVTPIAVLKYESTLDML
jgi:hypothetical protein